MERAWVAWFHTITLSGILILSFLFALFAIIINQNGEIAILFEYILFGWILLAVPIWLTIYQVVPIVTKTAADLAPYKKLTIYDLKIDII